MVGSQKAIKPPMNTDEQTLRYEFIEDNSDQPEFLTE